MENAMPPGFDNEALEASQPPWEEKGFPTQEITLAEVLKKKGDYTAHIGHWHLGRRRRTSTHSSCTGPIGADLSRSALARF